MKTTKKHFELFKKECFKWRGIFNLDGVNLEFSHTEISGGFACSTYDYDGYVAHIELGLTIDCDRKTVAVEIDRLARHEMTHVLTGDVAHLLEQRYITQEQGERAIEKLVCDLTHIIDVMSK